jgi:hypothetical protein
MDRRGSHAQGMRNRHHRKASGKQRR